MAPTLLLVIALAFAISMQGTLGNMIECENLNEHSCGYAVSSTGKRCVLEKRMLTGYTCVTSDVRADKLENHIESDECIAACGADKTALGISSDSLLDNKFAQSLCSYECYGNCANIVDLYFNLAAAEGVYLPKFCEVRASNSNGRREMMNLFQSSSQVAASPVAAVSLDEVEGASAPSPGFLL